MQVMRNLTATVAAVAIVAVGFGAPASADAVHPPDEETQERTQAQQAREEPRERQGQERPSEATEAAERMQTQTRPSAEAGPRYALTLTGEVVSMLNGAIEVRTTTGVETIRLTDRTTLRAEPEPGEWVAVDFNRSDGEPAIAEQIRPVTRYDLEAAGVTFEAVDEATTERTRLRGESGPGAWSGYTVTGEVVSARDDTLVLDTVTGEETVKVIPDTELVAEPREGDLVAVDFTRDPEGVILAQRVRPANPTPRTDGTPRTNGDGR